MKKLSILFFALTSLQAFSQEAERVRRFSLGPQMGGAFILDKVKGFDMLPAISIGVRATYDLVKDFFAVGMMLNTDFVHFSESKSDTPGAIDVSSLTYTLLAELKPFHGMYFGPLVGLSSKAYAFRKGGFLSYRDKQGTDEFLVYGGFFGWNFKVGRRFYLGPRIDTYSYIPYGGDTYLNTHTGANVVFATKWTF